MENFFIQIDKLLEQKKRFVVARIVRLVGSAPRSIGTKCIIFEDGSILRSIGGGALEYRMIKLALEIIKQEKASIQHFSLKGKDLSKTEMLCGGIADIYLEPIVPENQSAVEVFRVIAQFIKRGRKGTLFTLVSEDVKAENVSRWMFISEDGSQTGKIPISNDKLIEISNIYKPQFIEFNNGKFYIFAEPVEPNSTIFIFGGGHVSIFLARIAKMVGFVVVIIDDRKEFANKKRLPDADEIRVLPFDKAFEHIRVSSNSYVVILTRNHSSDMAVLEGVFQQATPAYIGMIASSRKRDFIYQALIDKGISRKNLEKVHSPIGLELGAETPQEIAVSIMAELIKTKAEIHQAKVNRRHP